jgi:hypothetical protein
MKKGNVIDLPFLVGGGVRNAASKDHLQIDASTDSSSDDLQKAIQNLIYRLRELGPITQS